MNPVSLILVLSLSDPNGAVRPVLLRTLAASLDPELVRLKARVLERTPAPALDALSETRPVAVVLWEDPLKATVRAALKPNEWVERSLVFLKEDPPVERARAIAFTVAAMMPQWRPSSPVPMAEDLPVAPLTDADFQPDTIADAGVAAAVLTDLGLMASDAGTPAPPRPTGYVGAVGVGALPTLMGGGGLEGGVCWSVFCGGLSAAVGGGPLETAAASRLEVNVGPHLELRSTPWLGRRLGGLVRLAGGAMVLSVTRQDTTLNRWIGFGSVEVGALARLGWLYLSLSTGARVTGPTTVFINDVPIVQVPAVTGFVRLGVGWQSP